MRRTIRTAISIPLDLYEAVKEHGKDKKFSTTVCELIRLGLYGDVEGRDGSPTNFQPLIERVERLEKNQEPGSLKLLLLEIESLKARVADLEESFDDEVTPEEESEVIAYSDKEDLMKFSIAQLLKCLSKLHTCLYQR